MTEPTTEHVDAVARALSAYDWGEYDTAYHPDHNKWTWDGNRRTEAEREEYRRLARTTLTSTDPAVLDALEAALVRASEDSSARVLRRASSPSGARSAMTDPAAEYDRWARYTSLIERAQVEAVIREADREHAAWRARAQTAEAALAHLTRQRDQLAQHVARTSQPRVPPPGDAT